MDIRALIANLLGNREAQAQALSLGNGFEQGGI